MLNWKLKEALKWAHSENEAIFQTVKSFLIREAAQKKAAGYAVDLNVNLNKIHAEIFIKQ